mgnify:CR=1 FL=1
MQNNNLNNTEEGYDYGFVDVSLLINRIFYAQGANSNPTVESVFKAGLKAFKRINLEQKIQKTFYCFDAENNRRKIIYPEYKANRGPKDPVLEEALSIMFDFLNNGIGLTCLKKDGYEADDLIASLQSQIGGGKKTVILSADKDLLQLLDDNCVMMIGVGATKYDLMTKELVQQKYGIDPKFISTYLALNGDTADNFPGVDGVGPKTAVKLINEFGDYNSIIDNIDNISSKSVRKKFLAMEDKYLPQKLADLVYDIDLRSAYSSTKNENIKNHYMTTYNLGYAASNNQKKNTARYRL